LKATDGEVGARSAFFRLRIAGFGHIDQRNPPALAVPRHLRLLS